MAIMCMGCGGGRARVRVRVCVWGGSSSWPSGTRHGTVCLCVGSGGGQ